MAIRSRTWCKFGGGEVLWTYEYDDAIGGGLGAITRVQCVNNSTWPTRAILTVLASGRVFSRRVLPGDQLSVEVPTGPQQRLEIGVDLRGRIVGLDHQCLWGPGV